MTIVEYRNFGQARRQATSRLVKEGANSGGLLGSAQLADLV